MKKLIVIVREYSGECTDLHSDLSNRDWCLVGFSPRKQKFSLYIMSGFGRYEELLDQLGKHQTGKSCLYIKRLADIDQSVLKTLIRESVEDMCNKYSVS